MITYICGSAIKYSEFPKAFWDELDKLMADKDEIIVGGTDFDHRVSTRCLTRHYENISIVRDSTLKKRISTSRIEALMPSYIKMLKKCDRMIAVWDGESNEVFVNVMLLLALHKKCKLYLIRSEKCVDIEITDDFSPYLYVHEGWNITDMKGVLKDCGFEDQMIDCMLNDGVLSEQFITEIICKAPVSLTKKRNLFKRLQEKNNLNLKLFNIVSGMIKNGDDFELVKQPVLEFFGQFGGYINNCLSALNLAEQSCKYSHYYLFEEWYDKELFMVKSISDGMFFSLDKVMDYVKRKDRCYKENPDGEWYRLEVWDDALGQWRGNYIHKYDLYIYKGEICWFREFHAEKNKAGIWYFVPCDISFYEGDSDLTMQTPFKAGDIVNVDCRPFGPAFHALIVEGDYQSDCCMPQILFRIPGTDKWAVTALKHKMFYRNIECEYYEPVLSPLYRLRTVKEDEFIKEDELLVRIAKELNGDEEKGYEFARTLPDRFMDGASDEEVLKAWKSAKN